jgi:hypothetical protein
VSAHPGRAPAAPDSAAPDSAAPDDGEGRTAIDLGNEFAQVRVSRVDTRNGSRLLIESLKSGHRVALCPLELEALTWQGPQTFSAMIGHPFASLLEPENER